MTGMEEHLLSERADGTVRLYYDDSHLFTFKAEVVSCVPAEGTDGRWLVVLDRTAFFPEGGGQAGDTGTLEEVRVLDTRESGGVIFHVTDGALPAGRTVTGELDRAERFSRMQQHSAEHIVSGLVHTRYGFDNVGFHLGQGETTLDFNGELSPEALREIELAANRAVWENVPVTAQLLPPEEAARTEYRSKVTITGQVRLVTVQGYDVCACCAPHVSQSGEIGPVRIADAVRYKGGMRLTLLAGDRALKDYEEKSEAVRAVSRTLSVPPETVPDGVVRLKEESAWEREQKFFWQERYLDALPDPADGVPLLVFAEGLDKNVLRRFVDRRMRGGTTLCAAFNGTDETGYSFTAGSLGTDLRALSARLRERFGAKGGGSPEMIQGQIRAKEAEIRAFFEQEGV